jgi:hypothetical protein
LASVNIGGALPALTAGAAYIGLVSISGTVGVSGLISLASGIEIRSLATLLNQPALVASSAYIGLASVNIGGTLPALVAGTAYVGLASVNIGGILPALVAGTAFVGLVSVQGNVNLNAGTNFIGLASVQGNVNIQSGATVSPIPISTYTSFATIYSATGNATLFVPPSGKRWILKDLIMGALGRNEVKILSGAQEYIPFIALATTGGYVSNFGDSGAKAKANDESFVINLNSAATITVFANVRFE